MRAPNVTFLARARGPAHPSAAALAPGVLAAALVVALAGFAATGLWRAVERFDLSVITAPYVLHALRFTFAQAALSTLVSVVLGALLALALARRRFPLRGLVLRALGVSFVLPAIAAVFGIVALHGRSGFVSVALQSLGFAPASYLYGLPGIVLAHVFFNIPFAARGFLGALEAVPAAHWRLAESLAFRPRDVFARIDWPVLRRELPGLAGLIFILCATSFAIVLALGGGPQSATLEVAIFEALRFDFDINRAAVLSLVQIGLGLAITLLTLRSARPLPEGGASAAAIARSDSAARATRWLDALTFVICFCLVAAPALAALASGVNGEFLAVLADEAFWRASRNSLAIASAAAALACVLALALASGATQLSLRWRRPGLAQALSGSAALILCAPPFALATGLFIMLRGAADPARLALPLTALVNALMALPVVYRLTAPALMLTAQRHGSLIESLAITGFDRWRLIEAPLLARPLGLALATAFAFSLGDLGVAALFGAGDTLTLPLLLYSYLGSYQSDRAGACALILAALVLALFTLIERLVGGRDDAA